MSKKIKQGRGALVRRLRREYGLTEGDARFAAEGGGWGVDAPDVVAARMRDRNKKINHGEPGLRTSWFDCCPRRPIGWCIPTSDDVPEQPPAPPAPSNLGQARRRLSGLTALALALSSGLDRK